MTDREELTDKEIEILCSWVEQEYGMHQGTWRCGLSSRILSILLTHKGIENLIVSGTCNNIGHVWVEVNGKTYDPTVKQFTPPYDYRTQYKSEGASVDSQAQVAREVAAKFWLKQENEQMRKIIATCKNSLQVAYDDIDEDKFLIISDALAAIAGLERGM